MDSERDRRTGAFLHLPQSCYNSATAPLQQEPDDDCSPTGTVTFLFTDIEGSTALWEQHPDTMRQALIRHDALIEQIVAGHDGHVVRPRGEGDSRFAVIARATNAVAAASGPSATLYAEPWPTPTPLRVRMALHAGEADLREGDYYGSAVNRCALLPARIRPIGSCSVACPKRRGRCRRMGGRKGNSA